MVLELTEESVSMKEEVVWAAAIEETGLAWNRF